MSPVTRTTTRLLEGLFDPDDDEIWREFDERYRPIIVGVCRKLGLAEEDAADVAQETLVRFVRSYRAGQYDRTRGRLRSWIIGIAKRRIFDLMKAKAGQAGWRGDSVIGNVPDDEHLDSIWQTQRRAAILRRALVELRRSSKSSERTIEAFEMLAIHRRPARAVAEELQLKIDDVYQAKNRIASRLRTIVEKLERLYDEDD